MSDVILLHSPHGFVHQKKGDEAEHRTRLILLIVFISDFVLLALVHTTVSFLSVALKMKHDTQAAHGFINFFF